MSNLTSPPYDVFDEARRNEYAASHKHNIVLVDYPLESSGPDRYLMAGRLLERWLQDGVLVRDSLPSFYIYRLHFRDETGSERSTVGVVGGLEVVPEGDAGVLPHERTTPKAKTDRLDLTRATRCNLSPVWGLSMSNGLSRLLAPQGEPIARCTDESGVVHELERVEEPARVAEIAALVESSPVLIADGHHRYAISRTYLAEREQAHDRGAADLTMTFVQELVEEQLSVAAIHRLYDLPAGDILAALSANYEVVASGPVGSWTISDMKSEGTICVVDENGQGTRLRPVEGTMAAVRSLDSSRLEHCLAGVPHSVTYQHGVTEVLERLGGPDVRSAVLIRPVSLEEIRRTAVTGELMPPKSTFFTPKLRTGLVIRPTD